VSRTEGYSIARIQTGTGTIKNYSISAPNFWVAMSMANAICGSFKGQAYSPRVVEVRGNPIHNDDPEE
jgi:hypothetical protein